MCQKRNLKYTIYAKGKNCLKTNMFLKYVCVLELQCNLFFVCFIVTFGKNNFENDCTSQLLL